MAGFRHEVPLLAIWLLSAGAFDHAVSALSIGLAASTRQAYFNVTSPPSASRVIGAKFMWGVFFNEREILPFHRLVGLLSGGGALTVETGSGEGVGGWLHVVFDSSRRLFYTRVAKF